MGSTKILRLHFIIVLFSFCFQSSINAASCTKTYELEKDKIDWFSLTSPNYPVPFAPQTQCTWNIWVKGQGYKIQVEFTHVDLARPQQRQCTFQWLNIKDGLASSASAPLYTLCGKKTPKTKFISRSNTITVTLESNNAVPENADLYTGFNLRFRVISPAVAETIVGPKVPPEFKTYQMAKTAMKAAQLPKRTLGSVLKNLTPVKRPKGSGPPTVDGGSEGGMSQEELNRQQIEKNRQIEEENKRRNNPGAITNNIDARPPPVDVYPVLGEEIEYPTDISIYSDRNKVTLSLASTDEKRKSTEGWIRPPPKGAAKMPHHTQVLLGIVGGILGAILLAILFKKCYWDRRKGAGDAYNSVKKFKDKNAAALNNPDRSTVMAESKELPAKQNNAQSDDSGVSTGKSNTNKSQRQGVDNPAMVREKRQPIEKPIGYMETNETKPTRARKEMPRNNTFDVLQKQQYADSDVDKWVSNTFDERVNRKRGDGTMDSNAPPPGYYDGMTPEEIEREERRRERRRRREKRAQEERERGSGRPEESGERRQKSNRHSGEERRHRRHRRR